MGHRKEIEEEESIIFISSSRKSRVFLENIKKIQQYKLVNKFITLLKNYDDSIENIYADGDKIFVDIASYPKSLPIDFIEDDLISPCVIASNILFKNPLTDTY